MVRVLLVANKTLGSGEVSEFVRERMAKDDCQFTLLVPATPRSDRDPVRAISTTGPAIASSHDNEGDYEFARSRLEYGLGVLRSLGAAVDGDIGDPDPAKAIFEVL